MKTLIVIGLLIGILSGKALAWDAGPPSLIAPDGTYLGTLSTNPYAPDSTSNPYGQYGSPYAPDSINNPYGLYGNPYSPVSPNNPYAVSPMVPYSGGSSSGMGR